LDSSFFGHAGVIVNPPVGFDPPLLNNGLNSQRKTPSANITSPILTQNNVVFGSGGGVHVPFFL
jgi:hypothetical protein